MKWLQWRASIIYQRQQIDKPKNEAKKRNFRILTLKMTPTPNFIVPTVPQNPEPKQIVQANVSAVTMRLHFNHIEAWFHVKARNMKKRTTDSVWLLKFFVFMLFLSIFTKKKKVCRNLESGLIVIDFTKNFWRCCTSRLTMWVNHLVDTEC